MENPDLCVSMGMGPDKKGVYIKIIKSTAPESHVLKQSNVTSCRKETYLFQYLVDDPSNEYLATLCTAIRCINHPQKYFEKVLRNTTDRPGTNEDVVTRVIVTRAEVHLKEIDDQYYKRDNVTLDHSVANDTFGDYKDFLLTLLGNED